MALKYFFEYKDDVNHLHRCEISNTTFAGAATEIQGNCTIDYAEVNDPLEAIRGVGMRIDLEADTTVTLEDLYTEEERQYKVVHTVDGTTLFVGFLKPDGVFQDFVNDKWVITMDCVDGLGLLENLSYVTDTGLYYQGRQTEIQIIANCLKRTGLQQNINTAINVFYSGFDTDTDPTNTLDPIDVLKAVNLNAERFYKEDNNETVMQCDEVLKSVLEKYCACITQQNGEWYIFRPNEIANNTNVTFYRYDSNGGLLVPNTKTVNIAKTLGSQISNAYPHHANANQRLEIAGSLAAYRVNYKYGLVNSFVGNTDLTHNGTSVTDYTILRSADIDLDTDGKGFTINKSPVSPFAVMSLTNPITVVAGDSLSVELNTETTSVEVTRPKIQVTVDDGTTTYYLGSNGAWFTNVQYLKIRTIKSEGYPVDGDVSWTVFTNDVFIPPGDPSANNESVKYNGIRVFPNEITNKLGEFHTVQRSDKPSSNIKDVKEIFNGDNIEDRYVGAIYKTDQTSPTDTWFRAGISEAKPILRIMVEDTLRMSASPARVFSGDIYGYMPYLSAITISGVTGLFMPLSYSYDTKANIISLKLRQIFGAELTDIDYEMTFDYGKTVKPTIIG